MKGAITMQAQILESGNAGRGYNLPVFLQKGFVLDVSSHNNNYVWLEYPELGLVVFPRNKVILSK